MIKSILSDDKKSADFYMSHGGFYWPILSADTWAINLAVELVIISPRKSADKIGRFYRLSVIGLTHIGRLQVFTNKCLLSRVKQQIAETNVGKEKTT